LPAATALLATKVSASVVGPPAVQLSYQEVAVFIGLAVQCRHDDEPAEEEQASHTDAPSALTPAMSPDEDTLQAPAVLGRA
jgi:hypothetical protein